MAKKRSSTIIASPTWIVGPKMQQKQGLLWYTIVIIIIAISFHLLEWVTRQGDVGDTNSLWFSGVNFYYLLHSLAIAGYGFFMLIGIVPKIEIVQVQAFGGSNILKQFVLCFGIAIAAEVTFGIILRPVLGVVSGAELVFFFVFGAIMEEMLYRFLIQNVIAGLLKILMKTASGVLSRQIRRKQGDYWVPGILGMILSSFIFMLAHLGVYGAKLTEFIGTFFLGIAFGIGYLISNNILVPILSHALINGFTKAFQVAQGLPSTMGELVIPTITLLIMVMIAIVIKSKNRTPAENVAFCSETTDEKKTGGEAQETRHDSNPWPWIAVLAALLVISFITAPYWFSVPDFSFPEIPPITPLIWIFGVMGAIIIPIIIFEIINYIMLYRRGKQKS